MNDQTLLRDMVEALFAQLGDRATVREHWRAVEDLALPSLLVGEEQGGFGGSWDDARLVFRASGFFALALPVAEAVLARQLAAAFGLAGRGTIASRTRGSFEGGRFSGEIDGAVESESASFIAAPFDGGGLVVVTEDGEIESRAAMSDLRRDVWRFESARAFRVDADVFALGAFARACQIAGALDAALAMSVSYANERQQFGRPIGKFQALQQSLATFACEAAAANCAAAGAAQALDRGRVGYEIAAAKLRANRAVGVGASIAHQAHGAIGFTQEYALHPLTRRLWAWRSEFGADAFWSAEIGRRVLDAGVDRFWPDMADV